MDTFIRESGMVNQNENHFVPQSAPYGFDIRPVAATDLRLLFQATSHGAISDNNQNWFYLIETKQHSFDDYKKLAGCLDDINQIWATTAPVLVLSMISFDLSDVERSKLNACHDLGLATGYLSVEAIAKGLSIHQMFNIRHEHIKKCYELPDNIEAVTALAIGYAIEADSFPPEFCEPSREYRPIVDFVYSGKWGNSTTLID